MLSSKFAGFLFCALTLGFITGCGDGVKLAPVTGKITADDGKPLGKIMIEFYPTAGGPRSFGESDAEGKYKLTTDDGRDGAVVGSHSVVLRDVGNVPKFLGRKGEDQNASDGTKPRIAGKYNFVDKSGLNWTVKSEGNSDADFKASAK